MKCYIVMFKDSTTKDEVADYIKRVEEAGGELKYDYSDLMKAVAVWLPDGLVQSFASDSFVDSMELDGVATTQG